MKHLVAKTIQSVSSLLIIHSVVAVTVLYQNVRFKLYIIITQIVVMITLQLLVSKSVKINGIVIGMSVVYIINANLIYNYALNNALMISTVE
jgi:hypothetical protein